MAPMRVADFKIDDALQAFPDAIASIWVRRRCRRAEAVAAVVLSNKSFVYKTEVHMPLALMSAALAAENARQTKTGRKQKRGESLP